MNKSCDNCLHTLRGSDKLPCSVCKDMDHWEGTCKVCINLTPDDPKRFCTMDAGEDGFNCCGDKFELNPN